MSSLEKIGDRFASIKKPFLDLLHQESGGVEVLVHEWEALELFLVYARNDVVVYGRQLRRFPCKLGVEIHGIFLAFL